MIELNGTLVGVDEAGLITGLTPSYIRKLIRSGEIEGAVKVGRDWLMPVANGKPQIRKRIMTQQVKMTQPVTHRVPPEHLEALANVFTRLDIERLPVDIQLQLDEVQPGDDAEYYWGLISGIDMFSQLLRLEGDYLVLFSSISAKAAHFYKQLKEQS